MSPAASLPIDIHCHGIGDRDVSDFRSRDLEPIQRELEARGIRCVLTGYLPRERLEQFEEFMVEFGSSRPRLPNILGIALEGPLLASTGGIPRESKWDPRPKDREYRRLADLVERGLTYLVLSPNTELPDARFEGIVEMLLGAGVRLALGHFGKDADPELGARRVAQVLEVAGRLGRGADYVITDHLFNDMPVNFRYAWRTEAERRVRASDLRGIDLDSLTLDNALERAGPVPASLIRAAYESRLTLCVNFDGVHVDPAVCRWVVDTVGAGAVIAMTDMAIARVLGQKLIERDGLWWNEDGAVAAGTRDLNRQIEVMRTEAGLDEGSIRSITGRVPSRVLHLDLAEQEALHRG